LVAIANSIDHLGAAMLNGVAQPSSGLPIQTGADKQQDALLTLQVVVSSWARPKVRVKLEHSCAALQVHKGEVSFVPSIADGDGGILDIVNGWVRLFLQP
jgi:hypothetical protein